MVIKGDFLVKEIYVKIITKVLNVFRTLFLLYFFSVSSELDNFYFAKSIIGAVVLINILFEITYTNQIKDFKDNLSFVKSINKFLNKFAFISSVILIVLASFTLNENQVLNHIVILCFWGILNINSNFFLILNRYKDANKRVLLYYVLISLFDILLLILMLKYFTEDYIYISISLSILFSEIFVFSLVFLRQFLQCYKNQNKKVSFDIEKQMLFKVFLILIIISFIDISDKYFLSFIGEGQITYYTYGLYAPLMIRQSLDIRTNFFVQISKAKSLEETKHIFFSTIKKITPFFLLGVIVLIISLLFIEDFVVKQFKLDNFQLLRNIMYTGILITPCYMIWDLFYRFYYKEKQVLKLLLIVVIGFILNLILNFILGIELSLGAYGILISTLLVFIFYNVISYYNFFKKNR